MKLFRNLAIWASLLFMPVVLNAQIPTSINIRTIAVNDSTTNFTFSWPLITGYPTYDLITFSNPRMFELEQFRVVTGNSWTISVPNNKLVDSLLVYGSVRVSMRPRYGAITYRPPTTPVDTITPPPVTKPWSIQLVSQEVLADTMRVVVTVKVTRVSDGTPVTGITTRWTSVSGGGFGEAMNPTGTRVTNSSGNAAIGWITVSGTNTITISADSANTFTITRNVGVSSIIEKR